MLPHIEIHLEKTVRKLIDQGTNEFWFGEQGAFDCLSRLVLKKMRKEYTWIYLCLFPAYLPSTAKSDWIEAQNYELIYPDEVAKSPPQIAISRRNDYIAKNADIIVCYITHKSGGAYKAVEKARKCGKQIINIADALP